MGKQESIFTQRVAVFEPAFCSLSDHDLCDRKFGSSNSSAPDPICLQLFICTNQCQACSHWPKRRVLSPSLQEFQGLLGAVEKHLVDGPGWHSEGGGVVAATFSLAWSASWARCG